MTDPLLPGHQRRAQGLPRTRSCCRTRYDETIEEVLAALRAVNAQPVFDWMSWNGSRRYPRGAGLTDAPVADAMRLITTIVRGERFCDGTIARAVEDGSLMAAAERINAGQLDQPGHPQMNQGLSAV